ncbi:hypothetical protein HJFPF1_01014 [Paramyrothecium foliicola]|nr:hypothetical protein HJFPF1_01014 [Paramyrothecium foliicola]
MPAMWDRLRTTASPVGLLHTHKQRGAELAGGHGNNSDHEKAFWHNSFESRLHAVDATDGTLKYEIRRGKTVALAESPSRRNSDSSNYSDETTAPVDDKSSRSRPRQLQGSADNNDKKGGLFAALRQTSPTNAGSNKDNNQRAVSPAATDNMYGYHYSYGQPPAEQISPPSSPDWNTARNGYMHDDVSPIDDDDDDFDYSHHQYLRSAQPTPPSPQPTTAQSEQQSRSSSSSIPMLRRDRRKHQDAAAAAMREAKTKEKKDKFKYSGKASTSRNGGARLDQSGDSIGGEPAANPPMYGVTTTISGPQPSRSGDAFHAFGQRMRQQLGRSKPEAVESRPPWQGASGRTSLLPSVRDNLNVPPLIMPTRGGRPSGRHGDVSLARSPISPSDPETPSSAVNTLRRLLPSSNQKISQNGNDYVAQSRLGASSYPNSPYSETNSPYPQYSSPPTTTSHPPTTQALGPTTLSEQNKTIKRKPQTLAPLHLPKLSTSSSTYSDQPEPIEPVDPHPFVVTVPSTTDAQEPWLQPPSRFSVTTYATSSVAEDEHSPVPLPSSQPTSIMDRRRPNPGADSIKASSIDPVIISMKAPYPSAPSPRAFSADHKTHANPNSSLQSPAFNDGEITQSPDMMMSTSKALPPAPPELTAASDRVAHLNARLESLAHRRVNLTKSIKQMTELMPSDTLMASAEVIRKREIEKQKVEVLREELAEVQREEYDLGLKLHLAYKRLDREADFESTGLWVKRVTG